MSTDATPDYCPFCGARLRDEADRYESHLEEHEDCRERAAAWAEGRGPSSPRTGGETDNAATIRLAAGGVVAFVVLAYSLLIAGQLLLGVIAATIVMVAFYVGPMLV
jgi:hypothetical protein